MSLCPSSSHQLVAAAIAFRRARRKFPKDFGLENAAECASGKTDASFQAEIATSREGLINQARSSSSLMRRACGSRSDYVCPAGVRGLCDYEHPYAGENLIVSCACCRNGRSGEDIPALRDECSGGDGIDTVPSREREEVPATSAADKNVSAKAAEHDRCDMAPRATRAEEEAAKTMEWISRCARGSTFYHHRKARCSSRPCSSLATGGLTRDASFRENGRIASGESSADKGKDFASLSCHGTSVGLDDGVAENVVTSDGLRTHSSSAEDAWTKLNALTPRRRTADSSCRCRCEESHPREEPTPDLSGSSCEHYCDDGCRHHRRDCFHCCCRLSRRDSSANAEGLMRCETRGRIYDGLAQKHKSWRDGESRLYALRSCSKDFGTMSADREYKDEERENRSKNEEERDEDGANEDDEEEDDDNVAVINHKDSMCILAEKYKAGRRYRGGGCEDEADRTGEDACNKSLTSKIIDQPELTESFMSAALRGDASVKHVCRAHCESCGTVIASAYNRGGGYVPSEIKYERPKAPSGDLASTIRCCSMRAPCKRTF
ncbi:uncharacterized protein LOC105181413 [Harpegnathos saltator]|uniref:uncharacterized protein LOC105181413 n=1 Tax=Harpegnathos saltator TaxID=610380 RepID=UPI000DBED610|nr:uncharacterized protein LOC105181413 [Harpegnathos saltator]